MFHRLPQVNGLTQHVVDVLSEMPKDYWKNHMNDFAYFMGHLKAMLTLRNTESGWHRMNQARRILLIYLEQDKDWIRLISWSLNALDINHSEPQIKVEIENFEFKQITNFQAHVGNMILMARKGKFMNNFSDIIKDTEIHLSNMIGLFRRIVSYFAFDIMGSSTCSIKFLSIKKTTWIRNVQLYILFH